MNQLIRHQAAILNNIKADIKEIRSFNKRVLREIRKEGTKEIISLIQSNLDTINRNLKYVEKEIFKLRFKDATLESIATLREMAQEIKSEKQNLMAAYSEMD